MVTGMYGGPRVHRDSTLATRTVIPYTSTCWRAAEHWQTVLNDACELHDGTGRAPCWRGLGRGSGLAAVAGVRTSVLAQHLSGRNRRRADVRRSYGLHRSVGSHIIADAVMKHEIELQAHSIVVVGSLNPAIFQPAWFAAENLINPREAQAAKDIMVGAQAALFQADWLHVQVVPDRFIATTENEAYYRPLHDLVAATFSKLIHTPVISLGINYSCHYRLGDDALWRDISEDLAPASRWSALLHTPHMRSLTMQSARPSGPKGHVGIKVEPSLRIPNGMYIDINNHYDLPEGDPRCRAMLHVLRSEWDNTVQKYKNIIDRMTTDE